MRVAGLYVPLVTPMHPDGAVDDDAVRPHVARLLAAGVDGLVALGTTGEFADLTADERERVVALTVDAAAAGPGPAGARAPVLVGVGAVGTAEACAHARSAERAGADGLLTLPPLYWKLGEDALFRHVAAVADATSLPVMLYDLPALAGTAMSPALMDRVARELPGVIGVKLSGPELRTVHAVIERVCSHRPDFSVVVGSTDLILPAMLAGAAGVINGLANAVPGPIAALLAAVRDGRLDDALALHRQLLELSRISRLTAPPILAVKAAAQACGSPLQACVRTLEGPAGQLSEDERERLVARAAELLDGLGLRRAPAPSRS